MIKTGDKNSDLLDPQDVLVNDFSPGRLLLDDPAQVVWPHDLLADVEHGGKLVPVPLVLEMLGHLHLHHLQHGVPQIHILLQELSDIVKRSLDSLNSLTASSVQMFL